MTTCSWGTSTMEMWVHKFCCASLVNVRDGDCVRGVLFSVALMAGGETLWRCWWAGLGVRIIPSETSVPSSSFSSLSPGHEVSNVSLREAPWYDLLPYHRLKSKMANWPWMSNSINQTNLESWISRYFWCVCVCFCVDILYCSPPYFFEIGSLSEPRVHALATLTS